MNFRKHLIHEGLLTESELVDMEKAVDDAVQRSIEFSENSPYPDDEELLKDVYVSYK
ncbi:pyruvate dehydrogenase (acetyl-transferring) E1 component%2C alpha subunit [Streptococcus pneumoniae]|nr:pyruvate dehydrogenase (acetyl-transferring) E1 component%2C alpha subunit [Streptococcus pneumoniae]CJB32837.1 pyruvate dehydrogenase (acetyl-transferring) E1 component%2C alpha subunit [Streptococcus pneumoniae]CJD95363.1 pyruvate dehydrogenase (acetyl-transferring) E1 component%2C alpha subunit [Streptococcus pneumoniae]COT76257.1 pyruvate dehydrogenase (acetyl-transferring) E1 component%2C alpha subunit [Streptococcus pneumoniae]